MSPHNSKSLFLLAKVATLIISFVLLLSSKSMAACLDNSTTHDIIYITAKPNPTCCSSGNSVGRLIRLCKSSSSSLSTTNFKNYCKISPQECSDQIWLKIREEAESGTSQEPILSNFFHTTILSHTSLETAISNHLAMKLCSEHLSNDALHVVFKNTLAEDEQIRRSIRDDLKAVKDRDPACLSYLHCFLNFKGFLACQAHRIAHKLWRQGRIQVALMIQSRVSEVFAVDIHPAAKIGSGVVFDHGTGVVIGETAVIGNGVTILHNVTLGGTGKVEGDRHPKIGDGVMIGAGAIVLGNVRVGENAKIGAGSVALKDVPAGATAVGNPARVVGLR